MLNIDGTSSRTWAGWISALALLVVLAGCDSLLDIQGDPNTIGSDRVRGEGAFTSRLIGSASDFSVSVGNAVVYGGLFTNELEWGGSFVRRDEIDRRAIDPANDIVADEPYTTLQIATTVAKRLQEEMLDGAFPNFVPDPENAPEYAQVSLFSGYTRLFLADLFCTLAFDNTGPEHTSLQVYQMAVDDFGRVIGAGGATAEVRNAALVGRARAHLELGNHSQALADALQVPDGFEWSLEYSGGTGRETNLAWSFTYGNRRLVVGSDFWDHPTVDDTEEVDPRMRVVNTGQPSFSGALPLWATEKHQSRSSPITIASWEEAQFLIAEIEGGATAIDILNELRERNGVSIELDPSDFGDEEDILRKVADEKVRTLLLQGIRMGDSRRFLSHYGIDLFPTSSRHGDQTCMPLPDKERNNNPDL